MIDIRLHLPDIGCQNLMLCKRVLHRRYQWRSQPKYL